MTHHDHNEHETNHVRHEQVGHSDHHREHHDHHLGHHEHHDHHLGHHEPGTGAGKVHKLRHGDKHEDLAIDLTEQLFEPANATWSAAVVEEVTTEGEPSLYLYLDADCDRSSVDASDANPALKVTVGSIPLDTRELRNLTGKKFEGEGFAKPIAACIAFDGVRYRYDKVSVEVTDQRGWVTDFRIHLSEDTDKLGIDELEMTITAEFFGVSSRLNDPTEFSRYVDTEGLVLTEAGDRLIPAEGDTTPTRT
ncbi:hypothetical protein CFAL_07290 [Corynebacterium falsenii DSM 44353]|uniref:hypothetical protein n=1 Tax=Corynebacterium falsenii TaxID=108486 RepID=UPI0003E95085|nr:hypothetical protein [Corynebacterium falsenii]AHI04306.1 hypothetical protein CFAL_07290 [Corynebacterium falsenii DSM 44353]UBI04142.1 hypothetical protein LA343_09195 [Corynebacterium falsenii]